MIRLTKFISIGAVLFSISIISAWAEEWKRVFYDNERKQTVYWLNPYFSSSGTVMLWQLYEPDNQKIVFKSLVTLIEFDCEDKKTRELRSIFYSGPKATGKSSELPIEKQPQFQYARPGTREYVDLEISCEYAGKLNQ